MKKGQALYSGKAKTLYATEDANLLICEFRDDTSAFDGIKKEKLSRKGMVNNHINAFIMQALQSKGVATHFVEQLNAQDSLVKKLKMIPIECVIRNVASGSLVKRLGVKNGETLNPPVFEFFLKNDELHDPFINESHIQSFGWASEADVAAMKALTLEINHHLCDIFDKADLILVDFKLEFGKIGTQVMVGDEFSPDACRLWDKKTRKILDKDRFRQDLGDVIESYEEVANRLGISLPKEVA